MLPFAQVLLKHGIRPIKHMSNVLQSEVHNIQTHELSLGMLVCYLLNDIILFQIMLTHNRKKHTT